MSIQKYFQKTGTIVAAAIMLWSFVAVPTHAQPVSETLPESTEIEAALPQPTEVKPVPEESEYTQLVVDYQADTRVEKVLDNLEGEEFTSVTIESNYPIGEDTMTDFMIKKPTDDLENLSADLIGYRNDFLTTLEVAPSEVSETVEGEKYTKEELRQAQKETDYIDPKAKQAKVLVREDQQEKIKTKLSKDKKIKELKVSEIKPEEKLRDKDTKTKEEKEEQPTKDTSLFSNPLKGIFSGVKTQAQSMPDWVPDYTSVSFFDTDEVGAWVYNDWQSPGGNTPSSMSITHGNGSMFVAHRGTNNRIYVGKWNSNGDNFLGWGEVPGARTDQAPAIEYYWGRVYLVHKGLDNRMYVNYTPNEGGSWTGYQQLAGDTIKATDLETLGNKLYLVHRGGDGTPYIANMSNGSNNWSGWTGLRGKYTDEKITLAANGTTRMYMGMKERGTQDAIVNLDATSWNINNWRTVRGYTKGSFGIVDIGGETCFLIRDVNDELVQGCNGSSNLNGSTFFIRSQLRSNDDPVIDKDWNLMQVANNELNDIRFRRLGFNTNTRGYMSEMKWNDANFAADSAYEQDIFLYHYKNAGDYSFDQKTYLTKDDTGPRECEPKVKYWTSNLPRKYLDTRFYRLGQNKCDSDPDISTAEISYTIGNGDATEIENNTLYYNYYVADKGELNRPVFKVSAALGERKYGSSCLFGIVTDRWCIFSEDNRVIIPYSDTRYLDRSSTYPYWYKSYVE